MPFLITHDVSFAESATVYCEMIEKGRSVANGVTSNKLADLEDIQLVVGEVNQLLVLRRRQLQINKVAINASINRWAVRESGVCATLVTVIDLRYPFVEHTLPLPSFNQLCSVCTALCITVFLFLRLSVTCGFNCQLAN